PRSSTAVRFGSACGSGIQEPARSTPSVDSTMLVRRNLFSAETGRQIVFWSPLSPNSSSKWTGGRPENRSMFQDHLPAASCEDGPLEQCTLLSRLTQRRQHLFTANFTRY